MPHVTLIRKLLAIATLATGVVATPAGATAAPAGDAAAASGAKKQVFKTGRYVGKSRNGNPISFTVKSNGRSGQIRNLTAVVTTECWNDFNHDDTPDQLPASITGLRGRVSHEGTVEVFYSPDEDTEYVVDGILSNGRARLTVVVGGWWDATGVPTASGPYQCDNWGTRYTARRVRR